ncbi:MAG: bifunctional glutamate N-acetyltransferase/amino-acid acetyltransferase ArgJ [Novibacillus thermophilus]
MKNSVLTTEDGNANETSAEFSVVEEPDVTAPRGFRAAGVHCGVRRKRLDLGLIVCDVPAVTAAVYTTNTFQAAPLKVTQSSLQVDGKMQAIVVNSGNANACTGVEGEQDAYRMQAEAARVIGIPPHYVGVASTGVIGERLPMDKISKGIQELKPQKDISASDDFCQSILTTDTCVKKVHVTVKVDGVDVQVAGAAKGSGMIQPNMATMLGFITTDAVIEPSALEHLLRSTTDATYNMIAVDGDTSTNDMVIAMASGLAGHQALHEGHPDWASFEAAFHYVNEQLAKAIARDGEGATKLIEVRVTGAASCEMARQTAKAVIGSNLVKTAVFGADPNWGRIICAVGYSGVPVQPDNVDIAIGGVPVVRHSFPVDYDEAKVAETMKHDPVVIDVDLHQGKEEATAWGCDLTYDYVRINSSYRT